MLQLNTFDTDFSLKWLFEEKADRLICELVGEKLQFGSSIYCLDNICFIEIKNN